MQAFMISLEKPTKKHELINAIITKQVAPEPSAPVNHLYKLVYNTKRFEIMSLENAQKHMNKIVPFLLILALHFSCTSAINRNSTKSSHKDSFELNNNTHSFLHFENEKNILKNTEYNIIQTTDSNSIHICINDKFNIKNTNDNTVFLIEKFNDDFILFLECKDQKFNSSPYQLVIKTLYIYSIGVGTFYKIELKNRLNFFRDVTYFSTNKNKSLVNDTRDLPYACSIYNINSTRNTISFIDFKNRNHSGNNLYEISLDAFQIQSSK